MCGIVGVIGSEPAAPLLLEALRRLEYRGYDSAGIATLVDDRIERRRAPGKLHQPRRNPQGPSPSPGTTGIGHTRWATHGAPTQRNAHPHGTPRVSVVHNGIIENHAELRAELEAAGQVLRNRDRHRNRRSARRPQPQAMGMAPVDAARAAFQRLEGAYALVAPLRQPARPHDRRPARRTPGHRLWRQPPCTSAATASPSPPSPAASPTSTTATGPSSPATSAAVFGPGGETVNRPIRMTVQTGAVVGKDGYRHFMEKELHEHPAAIGQTLARMLDAATRTVVLPDLPFTWDKPSPASPSPAAAAPTTPGMTGRHWLEEIARLPTPTSTSPASCATACPAASRRRHRPSSSASPAKPPTLWPPSAT